MFGFYVLELAEVIVVQIYHILGINRLTLSIRFGQGADQLRTVAIAAFDDDALSDSLSLDPENEFVIYLATVGKRPATSD